MRRIALLSAVALGALVSVPVAGAQGPATPQPSSTAPAAGRIQLSITGVSYVRGKLVALAGQRFGVRGVVHPYVAGQTVVVQLHRGRNRVAHQRVPVRPLPRSGDGEFSAAFGSGKVGRLRISAVHEPTPAQAAIFAAAGPLDVIAAGGRRGAGGLRVRFLQAKLAALGYAVSVTGRYDDRTARGVLAYRKVNRMPRTYSASALIYSRLARGVGTFRARFPRHGRHIEVSIGRQVMALINPRGRIYKVYPVSTGGPGNPTPRGSFHVFEKTFGYNSLGMLDSNYFAAGGYAFHGYHSVPTYPASHGCVREPIPDALFIYNWAHFGTRVDLYG